MKKILLSFLATATILVSCNKNDDTPNNPQQSSNLLKKIIEKETLVIKAKKGKDDRLFGTITNSEISKELKKKYDIDIDRKKIIVENPIKIVGEYIITIKLEQGVIADLKVDIVGE